MDYKLHVYHPRRRLLLLEFNPAPAAPSPTTTTPIQNVLLFVGGMYDNFRSPEYPGDLAALFPRNAPGGQKWTVMHVQLSSAGRAFGTMSLDRDVQEIGVAVEYIRTQLSQKPDSPVVLMGHSTGCQDLMHYLTTRPSPARPSVQGAILQAAVSDREALLRSVATNPTAKAAYDDVLRIAAQTPKQLYPTTILPLHVSTPIMGPVPTTLTRFLSLASPTSPAHPDTDDYFSSDLADETIRRTFGGMCSSPSLVPGRGGVAKQVLVLSGAADETVPPDVDKEVLFSRWKAAAAAGGVAGSKLSEHSLVIADARHDISGESVQARVARLVVMRGAVLRYLADVAGDVPEDGEAWQIWRRDKAAIDRQRGEELASEFKGTRL